MSNEATVNSTQVNGSNNNNTVSDFERTKPGKDSSLAINNPGNPVFSCSTKIDSGLAPEIKQSTEDVFQGYGSKPTNPMYMTSAMEYGARSPTVHTMPTSFHAKCQKFTEHLGQCGMYRNYSLNTSSDKSIV